MNVNNVNKERGASPPLAWVIKIENGAERLLGFCAVVGIVALCLVVMLQIFGRLFLETPPVWTEELSRYLFSGTVAVSVGIAYKRGELVAVELLYNALNRRNAHIFNAFVALVIFIFGWVLYPSALQFTQIGEFQMSPTMFFPMSYVFATTIVILVNLMFFAALAFIRHLLSAFNGGDQ